MITDHEKEKAKELAEKMAIFADENGYDLHDLYLACCVLKEATQMLIELSDKNNIGICEIRKEFQQEHL